MPNYSTVANFVDTLHSLKSGSCASVISSSVDLEIGDGFSKCAFSARGAFHLISFLVPFLSACLSLLPSLSLSPSLGVV